MKKQADAVLRENLRREMSKRHLSEADIAHRSGLSVSGIQQLLMPPAGQESVNLARVQRIADALGVSASHLLSETQAEAAPRPVVRGAARAAEATPRQLTQLIQEFFILPEADRHTLLTTASDMASKYRGRL